MPDETVEDKVEDEKTSTLLRALKLMAKVDWKSMMLMLTILGGAGGYAMDWLDDMHANRTHEASYDLLATRIEELAVRVEECEDEYLELVDNPEPAPVWETRGRSYASFTPEDAIAMIADEIRIRTDKLVSYKRARLPNFVQIAKHAEQEISLIQFMEKMKAKR